ncbi:hypothetical protein HPP92_002879 [Vanilla planifolia]|uniref:Neurochondrin n=1 Tax=Vanilla planifolia TaxID=51239 RepID=A0A835VKZ4_VANPL|nr:hypothetical protein HPP92_002879 [Vanilla planifolia]
METKSPSLEDCLKLLSGEKDEQKLAGLFLATKISDWSDTASVIKIYNALGARFLHRLLVTGMGKGDTGMEGRADWEAYLKLSVTVLAGFCRVPEIASSEEMVSKIPLISEIISNLSDSSIIEECYEFLVLVASASEKGIIQILESRSIEPLARHILHDGIEDSRSQELAIRLLQLIVDRIPSYNVDKSYLSGMSWMVCTLSRQFALLHNILKFEVMHILISFLSSTSAIFNETIRELLGTNWAAYISIGIMEILQNRIVSCEKLQALRLLDSVMYIVGESFLLEDKIFDDVEATLPIDKFLLLVLESARVEIAVHLNELAYLKYEASKTSSTSRTIELKRQNLAVLYSLVEKIIKLISSANVADGTILNEGILLQMISGLNETISLVLDFLQDAKDHCVWKGDDLLAAVRIIGRRRQETFCSTSFLLRVMMNQGSKTAFWLFIMSCLYKFEF